MKHQHGFALLRALLAVLATGVMALAALAWLNLRGEDALDPTEFTGATPNQVARGAYLALAGNCAGCHTARGGAAYAGGKAIATPFGTVYSSNLTPSGLYGLGKWTPSHFWRAMHHGRSRDGRLLYPAFPYTNFSQVTREDSDALFAYLRSLPAMEIEVRPHALEFPYNTQLALAVWRALYFRSEPYVNQSQQSAQWNRGAYLVQGLGHCAACHASRNGLGATVGTGTLDGSMVAMQHWYAPSLAPPAGDGDAFVRNTVSLLQDGHTAQSAATGLMAEVVASSTQHLRVDDLEAMAMYLKSLPVQAEPTPAGTPPAEATLQQGQALYGKHCADCHGPQGLGVAGIYPVLAGNPKLMLPSSVNLQQVVKGGGFAPSTTGNPRPYGMPPFAQTLKDEEIAAVLTYIRNAWGNRASAVTAADLQFGR